MFINSLNQIYFGDMQYGDREATAEEIAAWELSRLPTPRDLLAKLDADNTLTQRNLRETIMLMAEAFKVATNGAIDLSQVRGVQMVYAVEAEAEALREQVRAQQ
jgi:hypothetical protein